MLDATSNPIPYHKADHWNYHSLAVSPEPASSEYNPMSTSEFLFCSRANIFLYIENEFGLTGHP